MRLTHKGLTVELPDDDRRVHLIESILWGGPLPPALDRPPDPPGAPAAPSAPPAAPIPADARQLWSLLTEGDRKELLFLADGPRRAEEVEAALGTNYKGLMGHHSRVNRYAARFKLPLRVLAKGRKRASRRYALAAGGAELVKVLAKVET